MKRKRYGQIEWIEEDTGQKLAGKVNKLMERLGENRPVLQLHLERGFCAVITYELDEEIPQTLEERAHAEGLYFDCGECPHFQKAEDKRTKWGVCPYATYNKTRIDAPACELFYKERAMGRAWKEEGHDLR